MVIMKKPLRTCAWVISNLLVGHFTHFIQHNIIHIFFISFLELYPKLIINGIELKL